MATTINRPFESNNNLGIVEFNSRNFCTSMMTWKKQTACPRSSRAVLNFLTVHRELTTAPINVQRRTRATTCVISLWLGIVFHSSSFWAADFTITKRPDSARRSSTIGLRSITATTLAIGGKPTLKQNEKNVNAGVLSKPVIVEFHTRISYPCEYKNAIRAREIQRRERWPRAQNKGLIIQKDSKLHSLYIMLALSLRLYLYSIFCSRMHWNIRCSDIASWSYGQRINMSFVLTM